MDLDRVSGDIVDSIPESFGGGRAVRLGYPIRKRLTNPCTGEPVPARSP